MLYNILSFDNTVSNLLANIFPRNDVFDLIFSFLSLNGFAFFIWVALFLVYLLWHEKNDKAFIIYFLLSFFTTALIVNYVLKNIFQRDRPWVAQKLSEVTCPNDFSFPSGHSSGAFAGAVIFAQFDKRRKWFYYGIAIMIAYSRVYLHCHFLLDILVGALLGYSIGKLYIYGLASRIKI